MKRDVYFDGIAKQFEQDIYGSPKGYIRWNVLWTDLMTELAQLKQGGLRILDAGGGAGRMSIALAKLGHQVILVEPSQEMLEKARNLAISENVSDNLVLVNQALQNFESDEPFDVILNHAVLEWLVNPKAALEHLASLLKTGGYLSLMFHNRNAAVFKQTITGNFTFALESEEASFNSAWQEATRPLLPQTVHQWLEALNLNIVSQTGIRIFHDYIPQEKRNGQALEQLLAVEIALRKQEPFASLAQHIHLICQK